MPRTVRYRHHEKSVRHTLNLLGQWVLRPQCHSSGLREEPGASLSHTPPPLADRIVIFDRVLNLYYIFS